MNKTEQSLAAIFRHCDEVADGKRPPRSEKEGKQSAKLFLGLLPVVVQYPCGPPVEPLTIHPDFTNKLDAFLRKGV